MIFHVCCLSIKDLFAGRKPDQMILCALTIINENYAYLHNPAPLELNRGIL